MNIKIIITIDDYEISISQAVKLLNLKLLNLENIDEVVVIQSYLPKDNSFRKVVFKVENGKIDLKKYTYQMEE